MKLENKVIVITGSSQGLGEALAYQAAKEGAKIALVARTESLLKKVKNKIQKKGRQAEYFVCDIRNWKEVKETVKKILEQFKKIDILVNNAGVWTDEEMEKKNPERRKVALEINTLGHIHFTKEVLPSMKKKNKGYIFNIISNAAVADHNNAPFQTYGAAKWAMAGFTKSLRDSLKNTKIKVSGFYPGGIDTNLYENAGRVDAHNQPWMMKKEDVAEIIIFALTRPSDVLMERLVITKMKS